MVKANEHNMFNAVLCQINYYHDTFNADMLRHQVALHMIHQPNELFPFVQNQLLKDNESYESYSSQECE